MRLEQIKLRMEENLKQLKEYQEEQLKTYEHLMGITDIDALDEEIQYFEEEFRFTTNSIFKEIQIKEKENMGHLMSLAWEAKNKGVEASV